MCISDVKLFLDLFTIIACLTLTKQLIEENIYGLFKKNLKAFTIIACLTLPKQLIEENVYGLLV